MYGAQKASTDVEGWRLINKCEQGERYMALKVGQYAPDFVLETQNGEKLRLSDFLGKKHVVLAFFPLAWTPV